MLSHRIVYLRKKNGISQAQLAAMLNISTSTEGMYEQGRRTPGVETLVRMAKIFDVSLDFLLTGSEYRSGSGGKSLPADCPCSTCYWKQYIL